MAQMNPSAVHTIKDPAAEELKLFAGQNEPQLLHYCEPEIGLFLAESPKVIERALNAGYEPFSLLAEEYHLTGASAGVLDACISRNHEMPLYLADHEIMQTITGYAMTGGMLCAMRRKSLPPAAEITKDARRVAVLEHVVNPTNIGAIFRSAAALGMDAVLLTKGCADPLQRRAVRVSMGTVFQIPWTYLECELASGVGDFGFTTAAMALTDESVPVDHPALKGIERLAVILGSEGDGLQDETIAACDYTVRIPMQHGVDSLNVAAASAVAFWQLRAEQ